MIIFDAEAPADAGAREMLLDRAMGPDRCRKPSELLRRGRLPADGLSLVARDGGRLVGTVRLWNIDAGGAPALLLGPLGVDEEHRKLGVGAALMRLAVARAEAHGARAIVLVGDRAYYEPFGFSNRPMGGLAMPATVDRDRLLGLELRPLALTRAEGVIRATGPMVETMPLAA
jgi:predicted N-acetyltransferase YhbS